MISPQAHRAMTDDATLRPLPAAVTVLPACAAGRATDRGVVVMPDGATGRAVDRGAGVMPDGASRASDLGVRAVSRRPSAQASRLRCQRGPVPHPADCQRTARPALPTSCPTRSLLPSVAAKMTMISGRLTDGLRRGSGPGSLVRVARIAQARSVSTVEPAARESRSSGDSHRARRVVAWPPPPGSAATPEFGSNTGLGGNTGLGMNVGFGGSTGFGTNTEFDRNMGPAATWTGPQHWAWHQHQARPQHPSSAEHPDLAAIPGLAAIPARAQEASQTAARGQTAAPS